jgi:hypothetical protein
MTDKKDTSRQVAEFLARRWDCEHLLWPDGFSFATATPDNAPEPDDDYDELDDGRFPWHGSTTATSARGSRAAGHRSARATGRASCSGTAMPS